MRLSRIAMASAFAALLALASTGYSEGKPTTGSISGKITTQNHKPAAGVTVTVKPDKKVKRPTAADGDKKKKDAAFTATTDDKGFFTIPDVTPGQYVVTAKSKDVGRAKGSVLVTPNRDAQITLQLTPE